MARVESVRTSSKPDILRVFARHVADLGYDEVSLRMVAEELGISKGTIVHHYGSKDRLLEAVHSEYMHRRLAEARLILEQIDGPAEQVVAMVAQLLIAQRDDRAATVAFAREFVRFSSLKVMRDIRHMRAEYSGLIRDIIATGIEQGVFRPGNPDLVTLQIFGMCNWTWTWMRPEVEWSVLEIVSSWTGVLLSGLEVSDARGTPIDVEAIVDRVWKLTRTELEIPAAGTAPQAVAAG
jgi:TetR/AcrR family transcriptional regulator, cholesterol catabolism regulator